jgi:hypothetical protein
MARPIISSSECKKQQKIVGDRVKQLSAQLNKSLSLTSTSNLPNGLSFGATPISAHPMLWIPTDNK